MPRVTALLPLAGASDGAWDTKTVHLLSEPYTLKAGEIHNAWQTLDLPVDLVNRFKGTYIPVRSVDAEAVSLDGSKSIPLTRVYNHHINSMMVGAEADGDWMDAFKDDSRTMGKLAGNLTLAAAHQQTRGLGCWYKQGAEARGFKMVYDQPFACTVKSPTKIGVLSHMINVAAPDSATRLLSECPCTKNMTAHKTGTNDSPMVFGQGVAPIFKSPQLEGNNATDWSTYTSGLRCCENGWNLLEPEEQIEMARKPDNGTLTMRVKVTIQYWENLGSDSFHPIDEPRLFSAGKWWVDQNNNATKCAAATYGNFLECEASNIEYDVPQNSTCPKDDQREECLHTVTGTVVVGDNDMSAYMAGIDGSNVTALAAWAEEPVYLVLSPAHLHKGGLDMSLYNGTSTDESKLIQRSTIVYGDGAEAGNEKGYIKTYATTGSHPGPAFGTKTAPVFKRSDLVTLRARYHPGHHGVMSAILVRTASVNSKLLKVTPRKQLRGL